jgi:hypothetical protein
VDLLGLGPIASYCYRHRKSIPPRFWKRNSEIHSATPMSISSKLLSSKCQGIGRRTRVSIESMEEKAAYIPGGRGFGRDAS